MSDHAIGVGVVFIAYLMLMMGVGVFFYRRTEDMSDYFLGDRKLNKLVTALSAQASDMSGWLLLGLPGYAYREGLAAFWIAAGLGAGTYLNWRFVARRLRRYTEAAGNAITLSDYLENRFRDDSKLLRTVSAVFILVFFLIYTASGFVAGGKLFSTVFDFSYENALLLGMAVVVSYTFLGGFNAVCWTDLIQGILMFFALAVVPVAAASSLGGFTEACQKIRAIEPALFDLFAPVRGTGIGAGTVVLISLLGWGLGYFGQPHILTRFMAIRDPDEVGGARRIAMGWVTVSLLAAVMVGMVGRAGMPALDEGASETVFMVLVEDLFPPLLAGVLLAAILAAIMSTADSQLLVTASALTEDIYRAIIRRNASENELVWLSRSTVAGVAIIAGVVALNPESSVLDLVAYAWAGFGAAFGPPIVISLYWRRMTHRGALAGILTGGATVLVWKQLEGGLFELYEIVPGVLFSAAAVVLFSLGGPPPEEAVLEEFDAVTSEVDA